MPRTCHAPRIHSDRANGYQRRQAGINAYIAGQGESANTSRIKSASSTNCGEEPMHCCHGAAPAPEQLSIVDFLTKANPTHHLAWSWRSRPSAGSNAPNHGEALQPLRNGIQISCKPHSARPTCAMLEHMPPRRGGKSATGRTSGAMLVSTHEGYRTLHNKWCHG